MQHLDRRQWIKAASATGILSLLGGTTAIAKANSPKSSTASPILNLTDNPIRLNANENPMGPSPKVRETIINTFDLACRYTYGHDMKLKEMIATREGLTPDHIVITGGSREGLNVTGLTYGLFNREIIAPDPTYQALLRYSEEFGAYVHRVALTEDLDHDLEEMEKRICSKTGLIFVCNPNNPTGKLIPFAQLKDFVESVSKRTVVFLDEAYYDYIEEQDYPSGSTFVKDGQNVIVSRTFSKVYGLAGTRIGYLMTRPDIAERLSKRLMANTNMLALYAAQTAYQEKDFYKQSLQKNQEAKAIIYASLDELNLPYHKSHTNFVFFKSGREIKDLIEDMLQEGVQIGRPFPPLTDWCRISTGTIDHMHAFTKGLKKVIA